MAMAGTLACGFMLTSEYHHRVQADVTACVTYAKGDSPAFEASVIRIKPTTGEVRLRVIGDPRGEFTFIKCLMTIRDWTWTGEHSTGFHPPHGSRANP
jgi:hypothetical protein